MARLRSSQVFEIFVIRFVLIAVASFLSVVDWISTRSAEAVMYTQAVVGTITAFEVKDALKNPYFESAQLTVTDSWGQEISVVVDTVTLIRDPLWHTAYVMYLKKGMKVKLNYFLDKNSVYRAKAIYVLQE